MVPVTIDASRAADPGLRGPVPPRTAGPAAADRFPVAVRAGRTVRSWPLLVLAARLADRLRRSINRADVHDVREPVVAGQSELTGAPLLRSKVRIHAYKSTIRCW